MATVLVTIVTASSWPDPAELKLRNAVTNALMAASLGTHTGSGGGLGEMDFSFRVADAQVASAVIDDIMHCQMPGAEYRIRVSD